MKLTKAKKNLIVNALVAQGNALLQEANSLPANDHYAARANALDAQRIEILDLAEELECSKITEDEGALDEGDDCGQAPAMRARPTTATEEHHHGHQKEEVQTQLFDRHQRAGLLD